MDSLSQEMLDPICRRYHIRKLSLFGSVLRSDYNPASDVDILIEFEEGRKPGFFKLYEIEENLSQFFPGRKLDLVTPDFLNRHIRDKVLSQAQVQYVQG